jgi:hypothetical protein
MKFNPSVAGVLCRYNTVVIPAAWQRTFARKSCSRQAQQVKRGDERFEVRVSKLRTRSLGDRRQHV